MGKTNRAWATLARASFPDGVKRAALSLYPDPEKALDAILEGVERRGAKKGPSRVGRLINERQVEQDLKWCEGLKRSIIGITDSIYPALLKEISSPPLVLYGEGELGLLNRPSVAIVGSRKPTYAGAEIAETIAKDIAGRGVVIVSGLAHGVDSAAHQGAIAAQGFTIGVCATGLDTIYPKRNERLGSRIAETGLLLSEFPVGVGVRRHHFPQRNRIISGLSSGTVVIEAAERSGSLITAGFAADQGREVFAVPGSVYSPASRGSHQLIRDGACLVESGMQVLQGLGWLDLEAHVKDADDLPRGPSDAVVDAVDFAPTPLDQIADRSGLTMAEVSAILIEMECQQLIRACPGGYVRLR